MKGNQSRLTPPHTFEDVQRRVRSNRGRICKLNGRDTNHIDYASLNCTDIDADRQRRSGPILLAAAAALRRGPVGRWRRIAMAAGGFLSFRDGEGASVPSRRKGNTKASENY